MEKKRKKEKKKDIHKRPLQAGSKVLLQKHQLSPEISEHQLGAALPVQHPGGYTAFVFGFGFASYRHTEC